MGGWAAQGLPVLKRRAELTRSGPPLTAQFVESSSNSELVNAKMEPHAGTHRTRSCSSKATPQYAPDCMTIHRECIWDR